MAITYQSSGTAIQKSSNGLPETIAFCADTNTARMLVEALAILKRVHDANVNNVARHPHGVQSFLEHAGII